MPALICLLSLSLFQAATDTTRVVIYPASVSLEVGDSEGLRVVEESYNVDGANLADMTIRWVSSDPEIASITTDGVVTAARPGTARIAALVGDLIGHATVTVKQLPPATIEVTGPSRAVLQETGAPIRVRVMTRLGEIIERPPLSFQSARPDVVSVDATGRVVGHRVGTATVMVKSGAVTGATTVNVVANPAASYEIVGQTDNILTGDVVRYRVRGLTVSGQDVGGFTPAWSIDSFGAQIESEGEEGVFVAERPGTYTVTAVIGPDHVRRVRVVVDERHYNASLIKVGRGPIANHHSGDTWVFEGVDGRDYAYIGTFYYDWMKVWDVTDASMPVLTDSIQVDARRINDVKIHPNSRIGIITREGASTRRNGIVLLDLSTPAHPTILSEYTETVTGGVHNVWIDGERDLVYAVHNGTRDVHIIDISDPKNAVEVGQWGLDNEDKSLHDIIVQEGYAYVSYWDDGVVVLDVGAGTHGGTPTAPAFVSQLKYPVGNTHVAWRHGRYLFVGDEIFPPDWDPDRPIDASGYIHVLDMSDIDNPVEVARYEVPEAGAHNVWAEGDRLYVGYYQGGLRVVDISGELRGDLYRQGREVAMLKTTDKYTTVPNWPMTWGAQVFKGNIYTSDLNSGLWIARLVEGNPIP